MSSTKHEERTRALAQFEHAHYVSGAYRVETHDRHDTTNTIAVRDAATENTIATIPNPSRALVDEAVGAALEAQPQWAATPPRQRALVLRAIATSVANLKEPLSLVETHMGKPLPEARWDIDDVVGCFEYFAEKAEALDAKQGAPVKLPDADYIAEVRYSPVGVVAAITPWNYPLLMASWKVAPALAAGCCVVLKPSELSPLACLWLASLARKAGLPSGVLSVLAGGRETGAALVSHPKVAKVAFTGSEATGVAVMRAAAENLTPTSLELGGKSAIVVFDDVDDLDRAVEWVMFGCFWTNGQICSATSRLLVHEAIADAFVERLVACTRAIELVDPLDPRHAEATGTLGPLVSAAQLVKVERLVRRAVDEGAALLTGGRRPPGRQRGYFYEPTVLRVGTANDIWRTEVFGPVLAVATFRSEAEAVALANGTPFGLAAAVLTADVPRAARVGDALEAGIVWINCSQPCFVHLPWGGVKRSGIGRELGERGLDNYLEQKQVTRYVSGARLGWYTLPPSKL